MVNGRTDGLLDGEGFAALNTRIGVRGNHRLSPYDKVVSELLAQQETPGPAPWWKYTAETVVIHMGETPMLRPTIHRLLTRYAPVMRDRLTGGAGP